MSDVVQTELMRLSYGPGERIIVYRYDCDDWPNQTHFPRIVFVVESNQYQILDISAVSFDAIHQAVHADQVGDDA